MRAAVTKELELGDVVYLKSGSPAMTITSITTDAAGAPPDSIVASWHAADLNVKSVIAPKQCFTTKKPSTR